MTLFWIFGGAMVLLALAFVLPAMLRRPQATEQTLDTRSLNTELFRERLVELEKDLADGLIEEQRFVAAREDLERELLHELSQPAAGEAEGEAARSGRWMIPVVGALLPLVALSLYLNLGESRLIDAAASRPAAQARPAPPAGDGLMAQANEPHPVEQMIQQLSARLQQQPGDGEGWIMLGRSLMVVERHEEAAAAFARAAEALPQPDADLLAAHAEAIAMTAGGRLAGEPAAMIERALQLEPDNSRALWLMGHFQIQNGNRESAAQHWQRLLAQMPADSQQAQTIQDLLGRIGAAAAAAAPAAAPVAAADKTVSVEVTLAEEIAPEANPQDTVFVFARASQGPRMPLAIIRGQVKDLPMQVTLDDSLAMTPSMVLSSVPKVVVGARVSKTGDATPQPGDLEGSVEDVVPGSAGVVRLSIDRIVR